MNGIEDQYQSLEANIIRVICQQHIPLSHVPVLTCSNLLMMFNLTSGNSSFKRCRKRGKRCSLVGSFPNKGAKPLIWSANAARTCCDLSFTRSRTQG